MKFQDCSWATVGSVAWLWDVRTHSVIKCTVQYSFNFEAGYGPDDWCALNTDDGSGCQYNALPGQIFKTRKEAVRHGARIMEETCSKLGRALVSAKERLKKFCELHSDILESEQ